MSPFRSRFVLVSSALLRFAISSASVVFDTMHRWNHSGVGAVKVVPVGSVAEAHSGWSLGPLTPDWFTRQGPPHSPQDQTSQRYGTDHRLILAGIADRHIRELSRRRATGQDRTAHHRPTIQPTTHHPPRCPSQGRLRFSCAGQQPPKARSRPVFSASLPRNGTTSSAEAPNVP